MSDRPPLDQRSRRRLARSGIPQAVIRRDRADQPVAAASASSSNISTPTDTAVSGQLTVVPFGPPTPSEATSEDSDDNAPRAITAAVSVYTHSGELAKRARPSSSSSGNSDGQEDKRVKLTRPAPLQPDGKDLNMVPSESSQPTPCVVLLASTRPSSPSTETRPPTPSPTSPLRFEAPIPVAAPPITPSAPSHSYSHSAHTTEQHESASWPKDSTSYAGLASPTHDVLMRPTSPQPSTSYAAAAASPRRPSPPIVPSQPASTDPTQPTPRSEYPPIVVECLPNWTRHFQTLGRALGHAPNARPFGRGVRFLPKTTEEFRTVQRYLTEAAAQDSAISWYCYSPATEVPTKVAIRGLPLETPTEEVIAALCELGFPAEAARAIPPARGSRLSCTYFVRLAHLTEDELQNLFSTTELLLMPQVTIEAWRGGSKPPQCHRCQQFNHSSARCHRPIRCVRCAGPHPVRNCQLSRDEPLTCANCGQDHAANDRRCVHYKREARRRGITQPAPPPRASTQHQQHRRTTTVPPQPNAPFTDPSKDATRPSTAAQATTPTTVAPLAAAPPATAPCAATPVDPSTTTATIGMAAPTTSVPTILVADANPPIERGRALRGRRCRRNRAPRPARSEPAAASTPHPRQPREAPPSTAQQTRDRAPRQIHATASAPADHAPTPQEARPTTASQSAPVAAQTPSYAPQAEHRSQGEAQTSPDIMAIVRVVVEAIMAGLTAYLQGQGALPAVAAGMAVLTRLHST